MDMSVTSDKRLEQDDRLFVKSIAKAFRVLEAFSSTPYPLTLSEIVKLADVDKSGVQRICHTLLLLKYLERDKASGKLKPGLMLLDRAFDYLRHNLLVERAVPILIDLRKQVQERVDLCLFDRENVVFAHRLQSKRETFSATLVGRRIPSPIASGGRAALAHLPDEEVRAIVSAAQVRQYSGKTTLDVEQNMAHIQEARSNGYALALEERGIGEIGIAAAILDASGYPLAAISIVGSLSEWTPHEFAKKHGPLVIAAANALNGK